MSFLTPHALTIRELLTNADSYYQIPDYQRPYKWTNRQLDKLWEDILEASNRTPQENYFLGPIITAKAEDGSSDYKDVIDGQQRLTTLAILCCAVREKYPSINSGCTENRAVTKRVISDAIAYGEAERIRFRTHEGAQSDFDTHVAKEGVIGGLEPPKKSDLKTDESKHKFINSALFLSKKLAELEEERAGKFINFLFNKVEVIRIDCLSLTAAMKIFQVINSTGIDLTDSDLVKSLLLREVAHRHKGDRSALDGKRRQFLADWGRMEKHAGECDSNMKEMLSVYEYYALARPSGKGMYEKLTAFFGEQDPNKIAKELKHLFGEQDPNKIAGKLKNFFRDCEEKIYKEENKLLHSFRYLPWSMLWKSVILAVILHRPNDFTALAEALRRFYYTYWIGNATLTQVKPLSFAIIKMVKEGKSVKSITGAMQEKMDKDKIADEARSNLASNSIANEKWCKPLLLLLEYKATNDKRFIPLDKDLHLEHVLPVKHSGETEWRHISEQVAGKYLQSAGNLALLSGRQNIIASNDSFDRKIRVYKGGEGDEGMTALAITRKIVDDYDHGRYNKQWDKNSMRARRRWFLEEAEKILKIGIDPDSD